MKKIIITALVVTLSAGAQQTAVIHQSGGWTVYAVVDTPAREAPVSLLQNASAGVLEELFPNGTFPLGVNVFVFQHPQKTILLDTGNGGDRGSMLQNLIAAGVVPEQIDIVLLTHMHGDHTGGLTAGGKAVFPNAVVYVHEKEKAYWVDNAATATDGARAALAPYGNRVRTFSDCGDWPEEITAVETFGHTAGHTGYLLNTGGNKLFVWGDLMHCLPAQIRHPEITLTFDTDPAAAAQTRRQILDRAAAENWIIAGMHLPFPAVGRIEKTAGAYQFIPVAP